MSVSPKAKRKKEMTRKEVMEKLKQNENDISKAVQGWLELILATLSLCLSFAAPKFHSWNLF